MTQLMLTADIHEYFGELVHGVVDARRVEASEGVVRYVIGLLVDVARPDAEVQRTLEEPLVFQLRGALDASGPDRFRRLRLLGDGVLYGTGFFAEHLAQRGVDRRYVLSVGATAYVEAASMMRAKEGEPDILRELSRKLERFVEVLADIAEGMRVRCSNDARSVVRLYERWLRTGSTRLGEELGAMGIVPRRAPEGLS